MFNSQWGIYGVHRCLFEVGVCGDSRVGCRSLNERLKRFQITASAQQPMTNNRGKKKKKTRPKATYLRTKSVTWWAKHNCFYWNSCVSAGDHSAKLVTFTITIVVDRFSGNRLEFVLLTRLLDTFDAFSSITSWSLSASLWSVMSRNPILCCPVTVIQHLDYL